MPKKCIFVILIILDFSNIFNLLFLFIFFILLFANISIINLLNSAKKVQFNIVTYCFYSYFLHYYLIMYLLLTCLTMPKKCIFVISIILDFSNIFNLLFLFIFFILLFANISIINLLNSAKKVQFNIVTYCFYSYFLHYYLIMYLLLTCLTMPKKCIFVISIILDFSNIFNLLFLFIFFILLFANISIINLLNSAKKVQFNIVTYCFYSYFLHYYLIMYLLLTCLTMPKKCIFVISIILDFSNIFNLLFLFIFFILLFANISIINLLNSAKKVHIFTYHLVSTLVKTRPVERSTRYKSLLI